MNPDEAKIQILWDEVARAGFNPLELAPRPDTPSIPPASPQTHPEGSGQRMVPRDALIEMVKRWEIYSNIGAHQPVDVGIQACAQELAKLIGMTEEEK